MLPHRSIDRRRFLTTAALGAGAMMLPRPLFAEADDKGTVFHAPVHPITSGTKAHWFSYYDKHQFDLTDRFVLGMEVDFEDRDPAPEDAIRLGMIDLEEGNRWIPVGETTAWCWQQGCMLQWLPGSDSKVIFNTRLSDRYGAVIKDVKTGEEKVIEAAIYTVSPDGKTAMGLNFARVGRLRPGYGYEGVVDAYADEGIPEKDGIYRIDLESGKSELVIPLARMLETAPQESMASSLNWFNHLLFSPDGERFILLHRWRPDMNTRWDTRMITARPDGSELHVVADHQLVSHFIWRNPTQILAWSREPEIGDRFFLYTDGTDQKEVVGDGVLMKDGHCTYSPDGKWICSDTYPGTDNLHHLHLYRPEDGRFVDLGRFHQPEQVRGKANRCDLHARWNRAGNRLCIDSMLSGRRQMYLVDVSEFVG